MALNFTAPIEELKDALHRDGEHALLHELEKTEDVPRLVEVVSDRPGAEIAADRHARERAIHGKTYEEANWPKLSPMFRRAHNELRVRRGETPIPEPIIDLYVPPPQPARNRFDPSDREFLAAVRQFDTTPRIPGDEGFTINGQVVKF